MSTLVGLSAGCASSPLDTQPNDFPLPCDVASVLQDVCQNCHSAPPKNGAPFPLVTGADTLRPFTAPPYNNTPLWQVMGDAVSAKVMPPPDSGVSLSATQAAVIENWVAAGAPEGDGGICP